MSVIHKETNDVFEFNAYESQSKPLGPAVLKGSTNIASSKRSIQSKIEGDVRGVWVPMEWPAPALSATVVPSP